MTNKMKPVIGILFDPQMSRAVTRKRTGTERLRFYHKAANKLGIDLFYTSLSQIDLKKRRAKGSLYRGGTLRTKTIALPSVFHNRSMPFDAGGKRKLRALSKYTSIFNRQTRYSKLKIHRLLRGNEHLKPHLPDTAPLNRKTLSSMMHKHDYLFLKPSSGSIGKGIYTLTKRSEKIWVLQASRKKNIVSSGEVYGNLKRRIRFSRYLVQEGIRLAKYGGRPFDLRVSIQRDDSGDWQVTGMVGKVAARGKKVTNIGSGGRAVRAAKLFRSLGLDPDTVSSSVRSVSLDAAKHLSQKLRGLADLGLDIGIDKSGKPYFIEMNGRDQRYSFREAGMRDTWYKTFENPLSYAAYLARRKS
jgi:hypothetical protein